MSSQIGDITEKVDYNVLDKVYSIWICFDVPDYAANTVSKYHFVKEDILGSFTKIKKSDYDLMETIIIRLSKKTPKLATIYLIYFMDYSGIWNTMKKYQG